MNALMNAGIQMGTNFLSGLTDAGISAILGNTGRMSHEHFIEANERADITNTYNIGRTKAFLEGVAPAQGEAYNAYQDLTYDEDTARQQERMNALFPGTSSWERLGTGSASPIPSPGAPQGQQGQADMFLPLMTTKMQTDAQKDIAAANNRTAIEIEGIRQGTDMRHTAGTSAASVKQTAAQTLLTGGQAAVAQATVDRTKQQTLIDALDFVFSTLPSETIDTAIFKSTAKPGWKAIAQAMASKTDVNYQTADKEGVQGIIAQLPDEAQAQFRNDFLELLGIATSAAKGATNVAKSIGEGAKNTGKFLGNIGRHMTKRPNTSLIGRKEADRIDIR